MDTDFVQDPPELENQYDRDRVLKSYTRRQMPDSILKTIEPELEDVGEKATNELYELQQADLERRHDRVPHHSPLPGDDASTATRTRRFCRRPSAVSFEATG